MTLRRILILAFLLRVVGIWFGLPYIYHQDEPVIVNHAMVLGVRGLNPHFFIIPSLTIYLLFGIYGIFYLMGHWAGVFHESSNFALLFVKDPTLFYVLGRFFLGVLFGTATVAVLYRLGKDFFNQRIALIASLLLAVLFLHVEHSHYIYADIPLTFFIFVSGYWMLRLLDELRLKNFILSGIFFGLACASKYTAAYFFPAFFIVYVAVYRSQALNGRNLKYLAAGTAAAAAAFTLMAPYTFVDWENFLRQIKYQSGAESAVGFWHHLSYSLLNGTGPFFLALASWGLMRLRLCQQNRSMLLVSVLGIYYLVNAFFSQPFSRYMMPILPWLCLLAAMGWEDIMEKLSSRPCLRFCVGALVFLSLLVPTVYADMLFLRKDTRTQCLEWIQREIPPGAAVVLDNRFWGPPLYPTTEQIQEKYALIDADAAKKTRLDMMLEASRFRKTYNVFTLTHFAGQEDFAFLFQKPFVKMDLDSIKKIGARYLVFNYSEYQPSAQIFKESLGREARLVAVFSPFWKKTRRQPVDYLSAASAPDSPLDLFSRRRLGSYLEVFELMP